MMTAAPEMVPTLDDALRALDGFPGRPADVPLALAFLEQLNEVRDVPALVLDQAQREHMERAYQAGVRCADESGHVLVVSLPAFLELFPVPAAGAWRPVSMPRRDGLLAPFGHLVDWLVVRPTLALAAALLLGALVALFADHDVQAAGWLAFAGAVLALSWRVSQLPPTSCTYACNSGRACTCRPQPNETTHAR